MRREQSDRLTPVHAAGSRGGQGVPGRLPRAIGPQRTSSPPPQPSPRARSPDPTPSPEQVVNPSEMTFHALFTVSL